MTRRDPVLQRQTGARRGGKNMLVKRVHCTASRYLKHFIITACCWGLMPICMADWLVRVLRLKEV